MANTIALFKKYIDLLDEVYKLAATSSVLDGDASLTRQGANANEILIPKMTMSGMADYSRNSGYVLGDVSIVMETVKFNYDRGRKFGIDVMDDEETAGIAFGQLSSEFVRTMTVPEMDAFRFATYAGTPGIGSDTTTFTTGQQVLDALNTVYGNMTNDEVPQENRHLFINPTLLILAQNTPQLTSNQSILTKFASINEVPSNRFYTAIDLLDGTTVGEEFGGYQKNVDGKDINFEIIHKPAVMQYVKHAVRDVILPANNPDSDGYLAKFRAYALADTYENKAAGIYVSHK